MKTAALLLAHPCRRRNLVGLELVLDERAAAGKAALADGAVEGQRGGGAELTVGVESLFVNIAAATLACISNRRNLASSRNRERNT